MISFMEFAKRQPRTVATKQYELPKIDSDDVIGSLSGILGPSPEERAAEEQRLQEHRRKMHGWTALFNGLRHLSNLYYATKGAPGQKYSDPHQQIEQQYQDERKRLAENQERNRQYYTTLYTLRRQMENDRWNREQAIAKNEREEAINQAKLELNRAQVARQQALMDGDLVKARKVEEEIEQIKRMNHLLLEEKKASIEQKKAGAANSRASALRPRRNMDQDEYETVTEETEDADGRKTKHTYKQKRNAADHREDPFGGSQGNGDHRSSPFD